MFGKGKLYQPLGQIDVSDCDFLENSLEFARLWIDPDGPSTYLIEPRHLGADPFVFGMAMVDTIRHAARAYAAAVNVSEEHALERIYEGFDAERAKNTTDLDTVRNLGDED
jgi:hypothetical protein